MELSKKDESIGNVLKQIMKDQQRMFLLLDEHQKAIMKMEEKIDRVNLVVGSHIAEKG